jgi:hypothetical protein
MDLSPAFETCAMPRWVCALSVSHHPQDKVCYAEVGLRSVGVTSSTRQDGACTLEAHPHHENVPCHFVVDEHLLER